PTLQLHQLRILDETGNEELLTLDALWLRVDLFESMRQRTLVTSDASLVGLDLDLVRRPDGRIGLRDMPLPIRKLTMERVLAALDAVGELSLLQTRLRWEDQTGAMPRLEMQDLTLRLEVRNQALWADVEVPLSPAYGERLRASLRIAGEALHLEDLRGRFFLHLDGLHLAAWSSLMPHRNLDLWGRLDLRLWGQLEHGRLDEVAVDFSLRDAQLTSLANGDVSPFFFTRLESRLLWSRLEDGWRLSADGFELVENGATWPASRWRLEHRDDTTGALAWRGEADHLDLGALSRLLLALPLPAALEDPLRAILPQGQLTDLRFATRFRDGIPETLRLRTDFLDLHTRPHGQLPGIQGWSGRVDGDQDLGSLQLELAEGGLEQALFRGPLPVSAGGGAIHWRRADQRLSIYSNRFRLANDEVAGEGHWRVDVPDPLTDSTLLPYLDLQFQVERGQVAHTGRYLPVGIMNERAVAWLDRALVAGEITAGTVLFHGPLRGFPFDAGQGHFEVQADVEGAVLDYQEGWEPIRDLRTRLIFAGAGMEILGHEGRVGPTRLAEVRAHTPDLRRSGPPLRITGQASGQLEDMQGFLRASPLRERLSGLTDGDLRLSGPTRLELELGVPLRKTQGDFRVQGQLHLADNRLLAEAHELSLEGLGGQVSFTERSIGSRGLQARLWDAPVQIELDTRPERAGGYHRVRLEGAPDLVARLREWGWPLAARLEGATDWRAEIRVHPSQGGQAGGVYLELASDLRGLGVDMPEPLGKAAAEVRQLRLWRTLGGQDDGPLWLQYGEGLQAVLELEAGAEGRRLVRGGVQLGGADARLPDGPVLQLVGRLPRLSLSEWQAWQPAGKQDMTALPPLEVDLAIGQLELYRRLLRDTAVRLRQQDAEWHAQLSGRGAQGQVRIGSGEQGLERIDLDLDHLHVSRLPDAPHLRKELDLDPRTLPLLSVKIRELHLDDRPLGNLLLETLRRPDGLRVEQLSLSGEEYRLQVQGEWRVTATGQPVSQFELQLEDANLGALLVTFGHERIMESRRANALLVANWPGSPLDFDLDQVEGRLDIDIGAGQLVKMDAPAGRMLNILSIHSLQRRLALDFSDVFGKGFSFDSITGHVSFMAGDAYTQDLVMHAPSAQIAIAGRTGFVARDYDQLVTITPLVSSNLPLAGVLAGGPAVGAALFVAEKLFGERMNRLARYQYQVTGP
ncbi:MAG TPA: YhdP family protein, partial [Gammaproteobacteria bacterium]|nr:YhdP family protein [Gammaproteobacteria bacterium]